MSFTDDPTIRRLLDELATDPETRIDEMQIAGTLPQVPPAPAWSPNPREGEGPSPVFSNSMPTVAPQQNTAFMDILTKTPGGMVQTTADDVRGLTESSIPSGQTTGERMAEGYGEAKRVLPDIIDQLKTAFNDRPKGDPTNFQGEIEGGNPMSAIWDAVSPEIRKMIGERGLGAFMGVDELAPGGMVAGAAGAIPQLLRLLGKGTDAAKIAKAGGKIPNFSASTMTPVAGPRKDLAEFNHPTEGSAVKSITETNLRDMTPADAIDAARGGSHLKRDKAGQYVGAPRGVDTPEKLQALRESYDQQLEGAATGGDWYNRAREGVTEVTGDPKAPSHLNPHISKGDMTADIWGMTSAQRTPEVNLGIATKQINQGAVGQRPIKGTMPAINEKVEATIYDGERQTDALQKLGVFGTNINPNNPYATTGVNDIWHARAWGYKETDGSQWDSGLSATQHAFLDGETMLAVERANGRAINGKTDWDASSAQAAPWVEGKAVGLIEKKAITIIKAAEKAREKGGTDPVPTIDEALDTVINVRGYGIEEARAEANATYPDFFDKHTAYANYEAVPGDKTGHLPAMLDADAATKAKYTEDLTMNDEYGRDILYDATGIQVRPTKETQGFYRNEAGEIESNPGRVSRPMVGLDPNDAFAGRAMDQPSVDIMEGVETLRAVMLGQEGIGYHKPFPRSMTKKLSTDAKAGATGSLRMRLPGGSPTAEQLGKLNAVLKSKEFEDLPYQSAADILVDTGDGVTMINLGDDFGPAVVKTAQQKKMIERLSPKIQDIFGKGFDVEPAYAHGGLVPGLSAAEDAGKGISVQAVKDALTKDDAPRLVEILDNVQVQKEAGRIADIYEATSQGMNTPGREDLIDWLRMIADGRGRESLEMIGKVALPAAAGVIINQLFTSETSNGS